MCKNEKLSLSFGINKNKSLDKNVRDKINKLFSDDDSNSKDTDNSDSHIKKLSIEKYFNQNDYKRSEEFYKNHPELLLEFEENNEHVNDDFKTKKTYNNEESKPRYMDKIQEYVNLRSIEKQEINEEIIQKEIQAENNEMVFITSSYKNVLTEREALKRKLSKSLSNDIGVCFDKNIFNMRLNSKEAKDYEVNINDCDTEKTSDSNNKDSLKFKTDSKVCNDYKFNNSNSEFDNKEINNSNIATELDKSIKISVNKKSKNTENDVQIKILKARERYLLRKQARSMNSKKETNA
ncbi:hypothetical protein RS030_162 [Cryptosporidium xiaoi]|uniref:Nuclear speckle splicing regulatory protein 1 N-terminal domain-containing protein n=1 Tax=Cryptosporidium xiaoi TaxID=659607 RepID=A0AAV9Y0N1_9CRYT